MVIIPAGRTRTPHTTTRTSRSLRGAVLGAALALVAGLLLAPPAQAADSWSGIWTTVHKFGTPTLDIELKKDKGPDTLKGTYTNSDGTTGKITGTVEKDGSTQVWSGKFKDDSGNSVGKFSVKLQSDEVSFKGWFKTCGSFVCSEKYKWKGEHA